MLRVLSIDESLRLYQSIPKFSLLKETRFASRPLDPPYWAPPYSSLVKDVISQGKVHKRKAVEREAALHSVKMQAGKSSPSNGELGRPAAADPILLPEVAGGRVLYTNI